MGLGIRVATPLAVVKEGRITDSEGRVNEDQVWVQQADWCAYSGEVDGKQAGVLLMPDPGNFRRCWFHARDYGLLEANPFGRNAFTKGEKSRVVVREGESLRLQFGVLVWGGRTDFGTAYRDFLKQTTSVRSSLGAEGRPLSAPDDIKDKFNRVIWLVRHPLSV